MKLNSFLTKVIQLFSFIFNELKIGFNQDFPVLSTAPTQAPQISTPIKPGNLMSWFPTAASPEYQCTLLGTTNEAFEHFADLCETRGCSAPYNIGCRVVDNQPQCICPTCPNLRRPVCASDDVQDLTECHLKQQACLGNIPVTVVKQGPCGVFISMYFKQLW